MSNQTPEQELNPAGGSAVVQRQAKLLQQKKLLLIIGVVVALMLITLLILAIGAIAQAAKNDPSSSKPKDADDIQWTDMTVSDADAKKGALVVVNKDLAYATPDDASGMVDLTNFQIPAPIHTFATYPKALMQEEAAVALRAMLSAFVSESGKTSYVGIRYAYRTSAEQETLGNAAPGYSDHHTGYGCELRIPSTTKPTVELTAENDAETYAWFTANAAKYGFIVRYPTDKASLTGEADYTSYLRYVGVAHATLMTQNNLCMEEYAAYLAEHATKVLTVKGADGKSYAIRHYAVDGESKIQVPTEGVYTVSGTNQGGMVVTVDLTASAETESDSGSQS